MFSALKQCYWGRVGYGGVSTFIRRSLVPHPQPSTVPRGAAAVLSAVGAGSSLARVSQAQSSRSVPGSVKNQRRLGTSKNIISFLGVSTGQF